MVKKAPKHGPSPAAKLRAALFAKCGQELENAPNIWLVYSARNDRQWVLRSDAEFLHFLYLEFADNVDSFDLAPPAIVLEVNGENRSTSFDAIVNFVDGRKECRELKRSHDQPETDEEALRFAMQRESQIVAAKKMQAEYQRISLADLEPHRHPVSSRGRISSSVFMTGVGSMRPPRDWNWNIGCSRLRSASTPKSLPLWRRW